MLRYRAIDRTEKREKAKKIEKIDYPNVFSKIQIAKGKTII